MINVVDVSRPNATVPPKSLKAKMINPANNNHRSINNTLAGFENTFAY
ncbi:MAG: hypothetical protein UZ12_BCD005003019, partial [Bacteroidetes bacterium OLB12]